MFSVTPAYHHTHGFQQRLWQMLREGGLGLPWRECGPAREVASGAAPVKLWTPRGNQGPEQTLLDASLPLQLRPGLADELERAECVIIIVSTTFLTHSAGDCCCFDMPGVMESLRTPGQQRKCDPLPFSIRKLLAFSPTPAATRWSTACGLVAPITSFAARIEALWRTVGERIIDRCGEMLPPHRMPLTPKEHWRVERGAYDCPATLDRRESPRGPCVVPLFRWSVAGAGLALGTDIPLSGVRLLFDPLLIHPLARLRAFAGPLNATIGESSLRFDTSIHSPPLLAEGANAMPPQRLSPPPPAPQKLRRRKKKPESRPSARSSSATTKPRLRRSIGKIKDLIGSIELSISSFGGRDAGAVTPRSGDYSAGETGPATAAAPELEEARGGVASDPMGLAIFDRFKGQRAADPDLRLSICEIIRNLERAKPGCLARSLEDDDAGSVLISLYRGGRSLN